MESFVKEPNLPENRISLCIVDGRIPDEIVGNLRDRNIRVIKTKRINGVYDAIAYHPDIMLHHLGGREIIVPPNISHNMVYELENEGFDITVGLKRVEGSYPKDISYNVARFGSFAVCNTRYTDEIILQKLIDKGIKIIHVKQGYAKCSIAIVNHNSVITSDKGIHNIIIRNNINSLLINPGSINLFDMNYGFIGGASGNISKNEMAFFGDIRKHPDSDTIEKKLTNDGKNIINLSENTLLDLGTLIPLKEYSILML